MGTVRAQITRHLILEILLTIITGLVVEESSAATISYVVVTNKFCSHLDSTNAYQNREVSVVFNVRGDTTCLYDFLKAYQDQIVRIREVNDGIPYNYKDLKFPKLDFFTNALTNQKNRVSCNKQSGNIEFLRHSSNLSALILLVHREEDFQVIKDFRKLYTLIILNPKDLKYPSNFTVPSDSLVELYLEGYILNKDNIEWIDGLENLTAYDLGNFRYADRAKILKSDKLEFDLKSYPKYRIFKWIYLKRYKACNPM